MKVKVRFNGSVGATRNGNTLELDLVSPTLKSVLEHFSERYQGGRSIVNRETNELDSEEFSVLLNGSAYQFLPQKLLTPLAEGDEVQVFRWLELLGGG